MGQRPSRHLSESEFWSAYYEYTTDYSIGPQTTLKRGNALHELGTAQMLNAWRVKGTTDLYRDPRGN